MLSPARNTTEVLRLLDAVIARDPDFGPALAWAGICHIWIDAVDAIGGCADPEGNRRKGLERGRRALLVVRDDPAILANAAFTLAYLGEDIGAMIALVDRALSLNPGFARGWHASGGIRLIAGQPDMAIEHVERSLRLSPRARVGWGLQLIGIAHFAAARFEKAIPQLLLGIQEDPNFATSYRYLAASYGHLGRLAEAGETVGRLRAIIPWIGMDSLLRNPQQHELYVSGLRLAAGEAT